MNPGRRCRLAPGGGCSQMVHEKRALEKPGWRWG
jgi:hypothetical protein